MNTRSYSSRGPLTCAQKTAPGRERREWRGEVRSPVQTLTSRLSSPLARECKLHIKFVSIDEYEYIEFVSKPREFKRRSRVAPANGMEDLDRDVGSSATSANQSRSGYYYGKNKFKWSRQKPTRNVRTQRHNIIQFEKVVLPIRDNSPVISPRRVRWGLRRLGPGWQTPPRLYGQSDTGSLKDLQQ
ncbi:hypothetical protein EVAR_75966_1 [Eumeta japonica]|uniref:Uncharacterized protein n=1 Tax=Eumeta variegata TaxID=151549 RepID=A0A4C1U9Y4_EUMVA|nr:hypothetical protein EVAR_75966_1 [Eumeta japonica]